MTISRYLVCTLFVLLCAVSRGHAEPRCPAFVEKATLQNLDGKHVQLSCPPDAVLVINLWATWCAPCRIEIPQLVELHREFKDRGVAMVGISIDALKPGSLKPFVREMNIPYPVYVGAAQSILSGMGIMAIPATIIIDRTGKVHRKLIGYHSKAALRSELLSVLAQQGKKG